MIYVSEAFAANLRAYRARSGLGQVQVAAAMRKLGFEWVPSTVSLAERDKRRVAAEEIFALAQVFGTTHASLMNVWEDGPVLFPDGSVCSE